MKYTIIGEIGMTLITDESGIIELIDAMPEIMYSDKVLVKIGNRIIFEGTFGNLMEHVETSKFMGKTIEDVLS